MPLPSSGPQGQVMQSRILPSSAFKRTQGKNQWGQAHSCSIVLSSNRDVLFAYNPQPLCAVENSSKKAVDLESQGKVWIHSLHCYGLALC
jgi:hypothetical protein